MAQVEERNPEIEAGLLKAAAACSAPRLVREERAVAGSRSSLSPRRCDRRGHRRGSNSSLAKALCSRATYDSEVTHPGGLTAGMRTGTSIQRKGRQPKSDDGSRSVR